MIQSNEVIEAFRQQFVRQPKLIARAPGRVNLIGEHVDYNGGFVLPVAIDRQVAMAAALRTDQITKLVSRDFRESIEIDPSSTKLPPGRTWVNYIQSVSQQYRRRGFNVPAMDVLITGDVPLGSGLSSSAALCVCTAVLLDQLVGTNFPPREIALLAQAAEQSPLVGVNCGIMDQFISVLGERDQALLIDCHTLEYEQVPFNSQAATILIINSMKHRQLVSSEYNKRRQECEDGLIRLRTLSGEAYPTLRHVPLEIFQQHETGIWGAARKRVRHNITENRRVLEFAAALRSDDYITAGKLLNESHASLRDDFEVSCPELDTIVEIALATKGVYGARMTGAGFGGCALALVQPEHAAEAARHIQARYLARFGINPDVLTSPPGRGAEVLLRDGASH